MYLWLVKRDVITGEKKGEKIEGAGDVHTHDQSANFDWIITDIDSNLGILI